MASVFPPAKDADLLALAQNASTKITASAATYGLTSAMATALAAKLTSYQDALAAVQDPVTRTKPKVAAKNAAKSDLVQNLRDLNRFVQATKTVTDEQKLEIQFPVYASRTPIPAPSGVPQITATPTGPWRMMVKLRETGSTRRAFPAGVKSAFVFTYYGPTPVPSDVNEWSFQGSTSKPDVPVALNPAIPAGTFIYVTACWVSPRQQVSVLAPAVVTQVMGGVGGSVGSSVESEQQLKAA